MRLLPPPPAAPAGGCEHVPALTITSGREFLLVVICPCAVCGELVEFPVEQAAREVYPPLRLVEDAA